MLDLPAVKPSTRRPDVPPVDRQIEVRESESVVEFVLSPKAKHAHVES
jgi:hypothetical protein